MQVTDIPFTISDLMAIFCRDCDINIDMINISPIMSHLKKSPILTTLLQRETIREPLSEYKYVRRSPCLLSKIFIARWCRHIQETALGGIVPDVLHDQWVQLFLFFGVWQLEIYSTCILDSKDNFDI
jgi:hypothetical protein